MRLIEAPSQLAEYHTAQVGALTLLAQYAEAQPDDTDFNGLELIVIGAILASTTEEAESNLDPALRRLIDEGCIMAADSSSEE